jgi:hypothetical protein
MFLVVSIVVTWITICLKASLHLPPMPRHSPLMTVLVEQLKMKTSALIMWPHPSSPQHPPLSCHHTTPASFKCPGKAPNNFLVVYYSNMCSCLMFTQQYKIVHLCFSGSPLGMRKPLGCEYYRANRGQLSSNLGVSINLTQGPCPSVVCYSTNQSLNNGSYKIIFLSALRDGCVIVFYVLCLQGLS